MFSQNRKNQTIDVFNASNKTGIYICIKKDICLFCQFKVGIGLDQVPVSKAVLINAQQELQVVLLIPVHIKVGNLDPACQFESGRKSKTLSYVFVIRRRTVVSGISLAPLGRIGRHSLVQGFELLLVLDDGLGIDLNS